MARILSILRWIFRRPRRLLIAIMLVIGLAMGIAPRATESLIEGLVPAIVAVGVILFGLHVLGVGRLWRRLGRW